MAHIEWTDIALRLVVSMFVGFCVGRQREISARPAGMRTHMLVSVGACAAMMAGLMLYEQMGEPADPGRMGAQVVSGVGFLGAGTIIKSGFAVRGLTTAASLWAVACLGLSAGGGYFALTLLGGAMVYIILVVFDRVEHAMRFGKQADLRLKIECSQTSELLIELNHLHETYGIGLGEMSCRRAIKDGYILNVRLGIPGKEGAKARLHVLEALAALPDVLVVEEYASTGG